MKTFKKIIPFIFIILGILSIVILYTIKLNDTHLANLLAVLSCAVILTSICFILIPKTDKPITQTTPTPTASQLSFSPFFDSEDLIKLTITNEKGEKNKIEFSKLDGIKSQIVGDGEFLVFTKDFRTIKLSKGEVRNFYLALIESEYQYFKPGIHEIEIKVNTKPVANI